MAKAQIDVYRDWLGIQEPNRPLNHYQLLRLKPFEDDPGVVREHYRKMNAHVRKYAAGEYGAESQQLLNEIAQAMLCLTDSERKLEYDVSIGRKIQKTSVRRTLEDILIQNNIIPPERMKQVKGYADAVGIDLHEAVLQQKIATPDVVMLAYAESIGLPFVSLEDIGVDEEIAPQIDPNQARMHSFVPLMVDRGQLLLASPKPVDPDIEEGLRMLFEKPVRSTICIPSEVNAALAKYYPRDAVQLVRRQDGSTAPAATPKAKSAREAVEPVSIEPMSEEEKKNRLMSTVMAFNFTGMVVYFGLNFLKIIPGLDAKPVLIQMIALGIPGILAGSVAAFVVWKKYTR